MRGLSSDPKQCTVVMDDGTRCGRPVHAKGFCGTHWARDRNGIPMGQPFAAWAKQPTACVHCGRAGDSSGLCPAHKERRKRGADMEPAVRTFYKPDAVKVAEILERATRVGECLIAQRLGKDGYATAVKDENGKGIKTHRLVYRTVRGPIPDGYQVHHACGNRPCIAPEHLVLATQRENVGEMLARLSYERRIAALEAENARLRERLTATTF